MANTGPTSGRRRVPIFMLLAATMISYVGDMMTSVAVPWFVLETTGSAAKTGLAGAAIATGTVLAGFFGGPVVDRVGFKKMSVLADLLSGTTVALVPLLYLTVGLELWQLLALVFLSSLLDAPGRSARRAIVSELAYDAGMPIERANSAFETVSRLSHMLGPPVGGGLVAALGASNVLFLDAATFAASGLLVAAAVPAPARPTQQAQLAGRARGYLADLLEGLWFVRGNLLLLSIVLVVSVANLLDVPLISVILPYFARTEYGSAVVLGLMVGAFGTGAVTGTVLFGVVGDRLPRRLTFILSFVAAGPLPYLVLATTPPLYVIVPAFALGGILAGPLNPLIFTVLQERIPYEVRGRVFGVLNAVAMAGTPFGALLGGFLVEGVGLRPTVIGMGICYLAVTLSMFFNPALHQMEGTGRVRIRRMP
jgi:MFS family permease